MKKFIGLIYAEDQSFSKSVIVRFITQILLRLRGLLFLPIIAKILGTQSYAIYSQIMITLPLLVPVLMLELEAACIRFLPGERDLKKISSSFFTSFLIVVFFLFFIIGISFIFREKIALAIFGSEIFSKYAALFLLVLFFETIYTFLLNYFRTFKRIFFYSIIEIINNLLLILIVLIIFIFFISSIDVFLYVLIFIDIFLSSILLFLIWKEIGFSLGLSFKEIKNFFKYSLPLIPSSAMLWVINMSDRYMILHLLSLKDAGIYSASYSLSSVLMFFLTPISFVLFPTIIKLWNLKKFNEVKQKMEYSLRYYILLSVPFTFIISILSQYVLEILATPDFLTSRTIVFLIVFGYFFVGIYQIMVYIIHLTKKTYITSIYFSFIAILNLVLNYFLIPKMGISGAALATLISYLLLMLVTLIITRRWFKVDFDVIFLIKSILASLIMSAAIFFLRPKNIFYIILIMFLGLIIYTGIMILFKALRLEDFKTFKSFFKFK